MDDNYSDQQNCFICGNCSKQFETLADLTFHADMCFVKFDQNIAKPVVLSPLTSDLFPSTSEIVSYSQPIEISSIDDETDLAVESLALYSPENIFSPVATTQSNFQDVRSPQYFQSSLAPASIESSISRLQTSYDPSINVDFPIYPSNSIAGSASKSSRPRKQISLAGIEVTPGLLMDDDPEPASQAIGRGNSNWGSKRRRTTVDPRNLNIDYGRSTPDEIFGSGYLLDDYDVLAPDKNGKVQRSVRPSDFSNGQKQNRRVNCPVCRVVVWRQNLQLHLRSHNGQRPCACDRCPKSFSASSDLKRHLLSHEDRSNRSSYRCPFCSWTGLTNLRRHVKKVHDGAEFDWENVVTEVLPNKVKNSTPMEAPLEESIVSKANAVVEEVFQAVINGHYQLPCDELWEDALQAVEAALRNDPREVRRTWRMPRIECNVCWRVVRRSNFALHRRIHERAGSFECPVCNKTFRYSKWLRLHILEHLDQTSFGIAKNGISKESRGSSVTRKNCLASGSAVQLPWRKRKVVCHFCGLLVSQPKMSTHLKEHRDGVKLHHCDQCLRTYRSAYALRVHEAKVHRGILPYKCLECDYRCSTREPVVDHMMEVHGDIVDRSVVLISDVPSTIAYARTRKCAVCDVRVFLENFDAHRKKHTDPDQYEIAKRRREEIFRQHVKRQRISRVSNLRLRTSFEDSQNLAGATAANRTLRSAGRRRQKGERNFEHVDHDYF